MQSEWNTVGIRAFLLPGYSMAVIAGLSESLRGDILESWPFQGRKLHPTFRLKRFPSILLKQL